MAALTIKNIPTELYEKLKERAQRNRRSINGEVIACLQQMLEAVPIDPENILARARELRKKSARSHLDDETLFKWKNEGRS